MTFNVGDEVKTRLGVRRYAIDDKVVKIRSIDRDAGTFCTDDSPHRNFDYKMEYFRLVKAASDPLIEAKLLLEKNGFTVTEPPKPRTRKVVAYEFADAHGGPFFLDEKSFNERKDWGRPPLIIETFDWTEQLE